MNNLSSTPLISVLVSLLLPNAIVKAADSELYLYEDALKNYWEDMSPNANWTPHNVVNDPEEQALIADDLASQEQVFSGQTAIAVRPERWKCLSLFHTDFNSGAWDALEFYIHGGTSGGQILNVTTRKSTLLGKKERTPILLNNPAYIDGGTVDAGQWKQVRIPLSDLKPKNGTISRIAIDCPPLGEQNTYYIDSIRLVADDKQPVNIVVKTQEITHPIHDTIFGANAGYYMPNLHTKLDAIEKLSAAGISVLRYPGGYLSDQFHWEDFQGPDHSPEWVTNTDEFIQFTQSVGAEPLITVNFDTGTAQEAANWVRYTNVEHDWQVKYWEIGNETYLDGPSRWTNNGTKYMTGNARHEGANEYCQQMKAVDPSIKVGMVGTPIKSWENRWGPKVLKASTDCFDYYTIHHYPFGSGREDHKGLLWKSYSDWKAIGPQLRSMFKKHAPDANLDIALTEYNSYWDDPEILAVQTANMLFAADMIGNAIKQGVRYANYWAIGMAEGSVSHERYGLLSGFDGSQQNNSLYRQPSYYAFPLWRKSGDNLLATRVNRDPGTELAVYASQHSSNGAITLLVINKSDTVQEASIKLKDFVPAGNAEIFVAQGDSLDDVSIQYNGLENPPNDLSLVPAIVKTGISRRFSYDFTPFSLTSITIQSGS